MSKKGKLGAIEYQVGFGCLMALSMAFSNFICLRFSQTAGSAEACGLSQGRRNAMKIGQAKRGLLYTMQQYPYTDTYNTTARNLWINFD